MLLDSSPSSYGDAVLPVEFFARGFRRETVSNHTGARMPSAKIVGNYELRSNPIATGGAGELFLGRNQLDSPDAEHFAVKVVRANAVSIEMGAIKLYRNKIGVHFREFLMPITDHGLHDGQYYIVMPLADDHDGRPLRPPPHTYKPKSLALYLERHPPLHPDVVCHIFDRILLAVRHLHIEHGLVHGDIKPANIVSLTKYCQASRHPIPDLDREPIQDDERWVLTDFTTLRRSGDGPVTGLGSAWFRPPEGAGDFSGDVYSLGKTLLLLVTNSKPPTIGTTGQINGVDPFQLLMDGKLALARSEYGSRAEPQELIDLIIRACADNPQKRGTVDELRKDFRKCVPQEGSRLSSNRHDYARLLKIVKDLSLLGLK